MDDWLKHKIKENSFLVVFSRQEKNYDRSTVGLDHLILNINEQIWFNIKLR